VQGIVTGIGFVGAGSIIKSSDDHQVHGSDERQVHGVTTAASVWLASAVGVGVGMGVLWLPVFGVALALVILTGLRRFERHS